MSGSAVAVWQQAIRALEDCCSSPVWLLLPDSTEAEAARRTVMYHVAKVFELESPPLPKAVWKKLVQLKVPLQLGTAFTTATQHSLKSPPAEAAWNLLLQLVMTAQHAGAASLGSSIRQQLQQSGVLQQVAAAMSAMAADLQAEAATLAGDTARLDLEQSVAASPNLMVLKVIGLQYQLMYLWGCKPALPFGFDFVSSATWLWGPSGQVVAAMQLHVALMQHVSVLVQHVQQHAPQQQVGVLLGQLASNFEAAKPGGLMLNLAAALWNAVQSVEQQANAADSLQLLLLSPHTLPFVAMVLVIHADGVKRVSATGGRQTTASSSGRAGSSSSSRGRSSKGGTRQQQRAAAASANSSSSSSGACEQQLLQLLGLAPEVVAMIHGSDPPLNLVDAALRLCMPSTVCTGCMQAQPHDSTVVVDSSAAEPLEQQLEQQLQQRQPAERRHFEQQLRLLLPAVLLSSARHMLTPSAQDLQQQLPQVPDAAQRLLLWSCSTLQLAALLCENQALPAAPAPAVWLQEQLGELLQLTDQLMYQRPLTLAQPAAATAGNAGASSTLHQQAPTLAQPAAATAGISGSSSSYSSRQDQMTLALNAQKMLSMLLGVARKSRTLLLQSSSSTSSSGPSSTPDAVLPVAARFVEFVAALEAALRAVTLALHGGLDNSRELPFDINGLCADVALPPYGHTSCVLVQHMGLCGPVALAQEQRQLYSLLSTVLKMGRCKSTGAAAWPCWGDLAAGSCCLAAAHAAVGLLTMAGSAASAAATDQQSVAVAAAPAAAAVPAAAGGASAAAPAAAAAAQQHPVDYLPSLVIFGRCCLHWAEQLSEHAPDLLLLASGALPRERNYLRHIHSAYFSCIDAKGLAVGRRGSVLGGLIATVSGWVGSLVSDAALTQLQAAGCAPLQLQQQLLALLLAHQGTQQGKLTDASLAALVQQLQATGSMLRNIAVPHFCNNPACGNLSGPTEVQLVSGRSCVCAGCRTARYCGRACQRAAWRQHKPVCEALAAAATAPAQLAIG